MVRLLISLVLHLAANAIGLIVAALVLPDMSIDGVAFIVAVLLFTAVEVIAEALVGQVAQRKAQAIAGATSLIATYIGLLITELVSDGLTIEGIGTWILATVIVWVAALVAGLILPLIFLRERREHRAAT